MIEGSKYCGDLMKKHFHKELVMTKKHNERFENSTKFWICDDDYIDKDFKEREHCHITGKIRGSAHRDCNIVFHNLRNYDSHLIMPELDKFNLKINVTPNALEKYMSFTTNNKFNFIDNFKFLHSSLDNLVKNLIKIFFKYLSKEFDKNVLDLGKQKGFYP